MIQNTNPAVMNETNQFDRSVLKRNMKAIEFKQDTTAEIISNGSLMKA
jgi:hypothetical protein